MNIAILTVSSLSLACSAGSLYFMWKTRKNVKATTDTIKAEVETVKTKAAHNAQVVRTALGEMVV